jgi:hypothetical protein
LNMGSVKKPHWLHHGGRGLDECHLLPKGFDHSFICLGNDQNGN